MTILSLVGIAAAVVVAVAAAPVVVLIVFLTYHTVINLNFLGKINVPDPKPTVSIFGILADRDFRDDFLVWMDKAIATYGSVVKFRLLHLPTVMICDPDEIKPIFSTVNLQKGAGYRQLRTFWGPDNLVTLDHGPNTKWKQQRALVSQAFKVSAIRNLQGMFDRHAEALASRLESLADQEVDFVQESVRVTLNIISEVIGAEHAPDSFMESMTFLIHRLSSPLLIAPLGGFIMRYILYRQHMHVVNKFIYGEIAAKMAERQRGQAADPQKVTMLDILVDAEDEESGQKLTASEIRDHLFTFFLAGHETTSNTISWLCYALATNPKVEKELAEELDQFSLPIDHDSLRKLTYTENCLNETLRMYPPVVSLNRQAAQPFPLTTQPGTVLPAQINVIFNIFSMHRDARYWDRPEEFDPSRWDQVREPGQAPAYMPFSAGSRICIGKNFFFAEAITLVANIYKRVRFDLVESVEANGKMATESGLLKPKAVKVYVRRR